MTLDGHRAMMEAAMMAVCSTETMPPAPTTIAGAPAEMVVWFIASPVFGVS